MPPEGLDDRYLAIYLNDHLAGATGGRQLVKRAASSNAGTPYGEFLSELEHEIAEDLASLERIMDRLEVGKDPLKQVAAFGAEMLGRLKLNGQLIGYSPLSRLVELEVLALGIEGKLALWHALRQIAPADERLDEEELDVLIQRAGRQREDLEPHRLAAAEEALTAEAGTSVR